MDSPRSRSRHACRALSRPCLSASVSRRKRLTSASLACGEHRWQQTRATIMTVMTTFSVLGVTRRYLEERGGGLALCHRSPKNFLERKNALGPLILEIGAWHRRNQRTTLRRPLTSRLLAFADNAASRSTCCLRALSSSARSESRARRRCLSWREGIVVGRRDRAKGTQPTK